jgi:hypothetical protein
MKAKWISWGIFICVFFFGIFIGNGIMNGYGEHSFANAFVSLKGSIGDISHEIFGGEDVEEVMVSEHEEVIDPIKKCENIETETSDMYQRIMFHEIAWMGSTEGSSYEWFEIKNKSNEDINIGEWWIFDKTSAIKISVPKGTILLKGEILVFGRVVNGVVSGVSDAIPFANVIGNSDETLTLRDASCKIVDIANGDPSWPAGNAKLRKTMERGDDGVWYTSEIVNGTPGKENSKRSASVEPVQKSIQNESMLSETKNIEKQNSQEGPLVYISEVLPGIPENAYYEFIEIQNNSNEDISLSGWSMKKQSGSGAIGTLISKERMQSVVVPKHGCVLFGNEKGLVGSGLKFTPWPGSYSLSYEKNKVILFDANGKEFDSVSWEEIKKGNSISREYQGTWKESAPTPCSGI